MPPSVKNVDVRDAIARTFARHALSHDDAGRALQLFDAFSNAIETGATDVHALGLKLGLETSARMRTRGEHAAYALPALHLAYVEAFVIELPAQFESTSNESEVRRLAATFVSGHIAGLSSGDTAVDYELAALSVRRLGTARNAAELNRVAVASTVELVHADVGFVVTTDGSQWTLSAQTAGTVSATVVETSVGTAIAHLETLLSGEILEMSDAAAGSPELQRFAQDLGIASGLFVPLMVEGVCEAILILGRHAAHAFSGRDLAVLGIVSAQIAARMRELRAQERTRDALEALRVSEKTVREQLQRKARTVDVLQNIYIPRVLPSVPGLRFDALYLPADDQARVGGDWYDAFLAENGRLVFSVGDVAGHGLDAAVTMGLIRQTIFVTAFRANSAAGVLGAINRTLIAQHLGIATAIVGIYDPQRATVRYASAGHPPPIHATASSVRVLPYGGLPLGIEREPDYADEEFSMADGDLLVLYTDALIEHRRDVVAGGERLVDVVSTVRGFADAHVNLAAYIAEDVLEKAVAEDDLAVFTIRTSALNHRNGLSSIQTRSDTIAWEFHDADFNLIGEVRKQFVTFVTPFVVASDALFAAELVVGEVLANAVKHAPGVLHVELGWDGSTPTLTVRDHGRGGIAGPGLPADEFAESGRGMFLVAALTKKVDVRRGQDGGTEIMIWFDLTRSEVQADG